MTNESAFNWEIQNDKTWPPRRRPSPPFNPTQLEILFSCPLRLCFEASRDQGYEPRLDTSARIGIAYHNTIESLRKRRTELVGSMEDVAAFAIRLLEDELADQKILQHARPRETLLEIDQHRVNLAIEAIIDAAHRLAEETIYPPTNVPLQDVNTSPLNLATLLHHAGVLLEVSMVSRDGMFKGRADRIEATPDGVRIIDYKSALQSQVAERYVRQLQFYAWLWHDSTGEWPSIGMLSFPLKNQTHSVPIDPDQCRAIVDDYRMRVAQLNSSSAYALALPGDVCEICHFRPWCKPFWNSQAESLHGANLVTKAALGFEGTISSVKRQSERLRLEIKCGNSNITVLAPADRFDHVTVKSIGRIVRALDFHLTGVPSSPRAIARDKSEIFLIDQD